MHLKKLFVAGLLSLVFLAPATVSAQVSSDIQSRIDALLRQLATLQAQQQNTSRFVAPPIATSTLSVVFTETNPRTATFSYTMNQNRSCNGGTYGLYFGDERLSAGEEPQLLKFPQGTCNAYVQYTEHTYANDGAFTAQLYDLSNGGKKLLASTEVLVNTDLEEGNLVFTLDGVSDTLSVEDGQRVKFKWDARDAGVENCGIYYPSKNGNVLRNVRLSGTRTLALYPSQVSEPFTSLSCDDVKTGERIHQYVRLEVESDPENPSVLAEFVHSDISVNPDAQITDFTISLQLTALDADVYVAASPHTEDTSLTSVAAKTGWNYDLVGTSNPSLAVTLDSTAPNGAVGDSTYFLIKEGETEEFTITVTGSSAATQLKLGALQFGAAATSVFDETLYLGSEFKTALMTSGNGPLRLTAPNGGEKWELGTMNSITWAPYGYNPDVNPSSDVVAYLEKKSGNSFKTVGTVMPSGKASIHWESEIDTYGKYPEAGEYYIRIENKKTKQSDRSDAPFTLTPRSVDLKVNGSDGPVSLTDGQRVTLTWKSGSAFTKCSITSVRSSLQSNTYNMENLAPTGQAVGYFREYGAGAIGLGCELANGQGARYDIVQVKTGAALETPEVKVVKPNGGDVLIPSGKPNITADYYARGVSSVSLALYKNDQFLKWIAKDLVPTGGSNGNYSFSWSEYELGLEDVGKVFKIYLTGKNADGSGYVDDKSDSAFRFISSSTPEVRGVYRGYMNNALFITTQSITKVDALANCKLNASNNPTKTVYCTWNEVEIYRSTPTTPTATTTPATVGTVLFDKKTYEIANPTLTGTAKNVSVFGISVGNGDKVYASGVNAIPVSANGSWSHRITTSLPTGTYQVTAYDASNVLLGSGGFAVKTVTAAPTCTLSASPTVVTAGSLTKLTWSSTNATSVVGKGIGATETSGSMSYAPTTSGSFSITFVGPGGQTTCTQNVTVEDSSVPATPFVSISASPTTVASGQGTFLSWKSSNAQRCVLQYGTSEENVGTSGGRMFYPTEKTAYRLICTNDPGTGKDGPAAESSVTVFVAQKVFQPTTSTLEQQASEVRKQQLASALAALLELLKSR